MGPASRVGCHKLSRGSILHRLSAGLHLRVLVALCNDVTECTTLRNEISARVEEMNQIQAEFRHKQNEVSCASKMYKILLTSDLREGLAICIFLGAQS